MSQRISLTRIIALNWYGFRQIFDVDDNILISGSFGTGKSAILDMIQYVMLGEGWKANRAAAGNARGRDLVGYCLGDTNQKKNSGERHFLRDSGVSVIALEFTRPANRDQEAKRETWGIRLEYSSPQSDPKRTYFGIPARLEYSDLTNGDQMIDDDRFRTWIRRDFGNDCLFSRQQDYLSEMATHQHLYFDREAFKRTFPKAMAFEPEENVEKFIRDFILEENPLDVRDVRAALAAYEETRQRLLKQENEVEFLRRICASHTKYQEERRSAAIFQHTYTLIELLQHEKQRETQADKLRRGQAERAQQHSELEEKQREVSQLHHRIQEATLKVSEDPQEIELRTLHAEETKQRAELAALRSTQATVRQQLATRHQQWVQWLRHGESIPLDGLSGAIGLDESLLRSLGSGPEASRGQAMQALAERFQSIWENVGSLLAPFRERKGQLEKRIQQLNTDQQSLDQDRTPGSFPQFHAARERLGNRVEQLARLIEVKPEAEKWWPAIELALGANRWAMVVGDDQDYQDALEILRQVAPGRGEGESLLHPGESQGLHSPTLAGSLWEKVEVNHPIARRFVESLLGDIVGVNTVDELESTEAAKAITPDGFSKSVPIRRRLKGSTNVALTLGKSGLERMRKQVREAQDQTVKELSEAKRTLEDVGNWLAQGKQNGLGNGALQEPLTGLSEIPQRDDALKSLASTIAFLSTPEREIRLKQLEEWTNEWTKIQERIGVLKNAEATYENTIAPIREALSRAEKLFKNTTIKAQEERAKLGAAFSGILDSELNARRDELRAGYQDWQECLKETMTRAQAAEAEALKAKAERDRERSELASCRNENGQLRHPEYQHDFPPAEEDNTPWAMRLADLETVELAKSRQLAEDRRHEWERRLEDSVLKELKQRTDEAERTIKGLANHLTKPVGKSRYRITFRRDTAGYGAAWRLLETGFSESDPLINAIAEEELQQAKAEMMKAINESGEGNEQARRLLDYRNYHHYDIVVVPADQPEAQPISLGKSGRNLSGGENQAPFFISMLAAFRRVYDRGNRQSLHSQQLGLVVMDEAFSKLSGDGIEDCLALANSFQLQLVMAFPPERLGVMVPHAQTVVVCRKHVEHKGGYISRIDNIPVIMRMADAVEALS